MIRSRTLIATVLAGLAATGPLQSAVGAANRSAPDPQLLSAYIYGYAPVALAALRSLMTAVPDATGSPGRAPVNQLARLSRLASPARRFVQRPSADLLYTLAWLDLARQPMILHLPAMAGRYYLIPLYDAYSNEFASIGSRTTGDRAGDFAILGPRWRGALPAGLRMVRAPTDTVWLVGRTLVRGPGDLAAAVAATRQFELVPLSAYAGFRATGRYAPPSGLPVTRPDRDFVGRPITDSRGFFKPVFFDLLRDIAARDPPPAAELPVAAPLVEDGAARKDAITAELVAAAKEAMRREMKEKRVRRNGWSRDLDLGNYGTDYLLRAAVARFGLGANRAEDAVYPSTSEDGDGHRLDGAKSYVLHFPPGGLPPAKGFWSLTVYDVEGFLVANPIDRYCVGSETGLVPNPDGSVDILLQHAPPALRQANWLPTPDGPFTLTLRLYWPDASVLDGSYRLPPVEPLAVSRARSVTHE